MGRAFREGERSVFDSFRSRPLTWASRVSVKPHEGVLCHLDSAKMPAGHLLVRCGNRRTTSCPSCAELYRQDTYQLIAAGLRGGKNIPEQVTSHPRVFATRTAPSYGAVHGRRSSTAARCRCERTHAKDDTALGNTLDPNRYDYTGAVLWNAHAPALWARFMLHLRRTIAAVAGIPQRLLSRFARGSPGGLARPDQRGRRPRGGDRSGRRPRGAGARTGRASGPP
ncbi:replication initiator [Streptomyces sp. WM4235]|uniref:replication initiator n=1 Tax=Streptomyces sp. WM4235 TaxID=1415551 RepID=UPI000A9A2FD7